MAAYSGQGLGYSRLTVPEDGLSQSLQFWGQEAGKRKAATDLKNEREKVRKDEEFDKASKASRADFTAPDAGYDSLTENYTVFSRDAANHYDEVRLKYLAAQEKGDKMGREKYASEMERIKTVFKEQQGAAEKLKSVYDQYAKMDAEGTLSDFDRNQWKMVKGLYNGDSKKTFLNYNRDNASAAWFSSELGEDGNPKLSSITMADLDNGLIAPIQKVQVDGKEGMIENYVKNMGEYNREWYSTGRDRGTKGYNEFAEKNLVNVLNTDLDDSEVKDLAAQFNIAKTGLRDPKEFADVKKQVVSQLKDKIMAAEKVSDISKLNLDEAELALRRQTEARLQAEANKPKSGSEAEKLGIRKQNITDVIAKNNVDDFKSGDFKWAGKKYTSSNAVVVGDKVVIYAKNEDGKDVKIPVSKTTAGLNELYNAFEDSKWTMDKVQLVTPVVWRDVPNKNASKITDLLTDKFEDDVYKNSLFDASDKKFGEAVKEFFPEATIENNFLGKGDIIVNGQPIYLEGRTKGEIDNQLNNALSVQPVAPTTAPDAEDLRSKYGY